MSSTGLVLFLVAFFTVILIIVTYPIFWKRALRIYWVWVGVGIVFLVYYLAARIIPNLIDLCHPKGVSVDDVRRKNPDGLVKTLWSNVLMLDMCPMMIFIMPILMIFDRKRRFLIALAPIALFAGLLSIFGPLFSDFDGGPQVSGIPSISDGAGVMHYIFVGAPQDRLFILMHWFLMVMAVLALLSNRKDLNNTFTKLKLPRYTFISGNIWFLVYLSYAAILAYSIGITNHAFGVVAGDWKAPDGEFSTVTEVIGLGKQDSTGNWSNSHLWAAAITGFIIGYAICLINGFGAHYLKKWKPYALDNKDLSLTKPADIKKYWWKATI